MRTASPQDVTRLLQAWQQGGKSARARLDRDLVSPLDDVLAREGVAVAGVEARHERRRGPPGAFVTLVLLLLPPALAGRANAQVLYGSIVGRVSDASQGAVPGAAVTVVHQETNLAREATTNGDGAYRFVNLLPGTYTVRVALTGFKLHVEKDVPVSVNAVARVDIRLEVGNLSEAITVESGQTRLQTDTGDLHAEFKSGEITALPLGNYRNYQTLLNLVPGTTPARFQNAVTDTPARALGTNVNGTAGNNNNTRLDGASDVYVYLPHHAVYVAPAETVSTVNVSTASFDAEQGMAGGAAVTVLTKSGTNELHGSAFVLHENEDLRARNFFNPGEKIDSYRNIVGATFGGPIVKDRLFFFGAWEGVFEMRAQTLTGTVATEAMRSGDFSGLGTTIYDPATGNPDGTGRTPFPGNVIPPDRTSPIAAAIQAVVPLPNRGGSFGNYTATGPLEMDRNNVDVKLNYHLSPAAQVWAKYSQMSALVRSVPFLGEAGGRGFGTNGDEGDTTVRLATLGTTWTLSPSLVLDGTIGMSRMDQEVFVARYGTNVGTDILGIPGTNGDGGSNGDIRTSGMPAFFISGFEGLGGVDGWAPVFRNDRTYNLTANLTYVDRPARGARRHRRRPDRAQPLAVRPQLAAGRVLLRWRSDGTRAEGLARSLQRLRPVPARPRDGRQQERPARDDDGAGVAGRPLPPRSLAGHAPADPQPGPAVRELPAHDARRPRDRVLRRHHEPGAPGRPGRQPRRPRNRGPPPTLPAPSRLCLPRRRE